MKAARCGLAWFNQPFFVKNIHVGEIVYFTGKMQADMLGPKLVSPVYEKYFIRSIESSSVIASHSEAIPMDGSTNSGIAAWSPQAPLLAMTDKPFIRRVWCPSTRYHSRFDAKTNSFLVSQAIGLAEKPSEWLSQDILEQADLAPLSSALRGIHFRVDENDLKLSADRLKFDELFFTQLKRSWPGRKEAP